MFKITQDAVTEPLKLRTKAIEHIDDITWLNLRNFSSIFHESSEWKEKFCIF